MLIRNAEIFRSEDDRRTGPCVDLRIVDGIVAELGHALAAGDDEVIDARGCAVIPGLHDHHLHFMGYAAARDSVRCGPPQVADAGQLASVLRAAVLQGDADRWLRGIGYHESVAGDIDRHWLDEVAARRPLRIQHRSGRLWILNTAALERLGDLTDAPLERVRGEYTGRLYDADDWLRAHIGRRLPDVRGASRELARFGITGFTDATPGNDAATFDDFAQLQRDGAIVQRVLMMGTQALSGSEATPLLRLGATKVHLHDSDLPEFDALCATIDLSHRHGRPVAVHCVTLTELVFTLGAFEVSGTVRGDRIEHAAVTPPELLERIAQLRLIVVTQPNFITERGDAYLRDVDAADVPWLYRLRGFLDVGVSLAAGTDAPFGAADPWAAMQAATTRRTASGAHIGAAEALTPEQALALFMGDPLLPGVGLYEIARGGPADLCVLDRRWSEARRNLADVRVRLTLCDGRSIQEQLQFE